MKKAINLLATGFYSGYAPYAPGTAGTVVGLVILGLVMVLGLVNVVQVPLIFIVVVFGTYIAHQAEKYYDRKDPQEVVIDEIAGFIVAMAGLSINLLIPAFILFRLFDILKPGPLKESQKLRGGVGIMVDDVGAGIAANILLRIILYFA